MLIALQVWIILVSIGNIVIMISPSLFKYVDFAHILFPSLGTSNYADWLLILSALSGLWVLLLPITLIMGNSK